VKKGEKNPSRVSLTKASSVFFFFRGKLRRSLSFLVWAKEKYLKNVCNLGKRQKQERRVCGGGGKINPQKKILPQISSLFFEVN
jgi:hypothetical protein